MEAIGKGVVVVMLLLKSLSPAVGNRVSTAGSYIPDPNNPPVIRIAVIPFDNVSSDANATDKMMDIIITYLLHTQIIDVAEPILVEQQLLSLKVRKSSEITIKTASELKAALGVDAILLGKITAYQIDNSGGDTIPVIALNMRLLDAQTLGIIWSSSIVRKGNDRSILFDVGRIDTLSDLSQLAANDLASGLGREVKGALSGYKLRNPAAFQAVTQQPAAADTQSHPAATESDAAAAEQPAGPAASPPAAKKFSEMLPEITDFQKGDIHERKTPLAEAECTYYKGGIPIFIKIIDCGAQDTCAALRDAKAAQQPGPPVNGDESTQSISKMGLLTLSVVRGRYLLQISGGEASLEDMRIAGKEILKSMGR